MSSSILSSASEPIVTLPKAQTLVSSGGIFSSLVLSLVNLCSKYGGCVASSRSSESSKFFLLMYEGEKEEETKSKKQRNKQGSGLFHHFPFSHINTS